jgi:hypothetical protein
MQALWLIILLFSLTGFPGKFELIYSGEAPSRDFYTDHLENIYFTADHKLIKIETATGRRLEYGSVSAGSISSADVSNPLQILIFYRDFNRIHFLNNRLSPLRSEINMSDLGINKAILTSSSGKGGFWVFSDHDNQLIYFDQQLQKSHSSMIISSVTGSNIQPVFMTESQNLLYLHLPGHGILVFDRYASYLKTIDYSGPSMFRVIGGNIIYFEKGLLKNLDIETGAIKNISLPTEVLPDNADFQPERIYIQSGSMIYSYSTR